MVVPNKKQQSKKFTPKKEPLVKAEDFEDDSTDEEELKKLLEESDIDDSEDEAFEEEDDSEEEEEEEDKSPVKPKVSLKREMPESDDEDEEEDDEEGSEDESEDEDSDEEEKETPSKMPLGKRARDEDEPKKGAKRVKREASDDEDEDEKSPLPKAPAAPKTYLLDTPAVVDPSIRMAILERTEHRSKCTVRLLHVPSKCTAAFLKTLAPDMVACRVPWNPMKHRSRGVAYLEFKDEATARKNKANLHMQKIKKTSLFADVKDTVDDISIDEYNCRRLVLNNLHWNTTKEEIRNVFPKASAIDVLHSNKRTSDKRMPATAFATFKNERDAIDAFDKHQGCTIHGHDISLNFQRKPPREDTRDKKTLIVFGVKKGTTEKMLREVFPNTTSLDLKVQQGMATLYYDDGSKCVEDHNKARTAKLNNRPVKVFYGKASFQKSQPREEKKPVIEAPKAVDIKTDLFVKNLAKESTLEEVKALFPKARDVFMPFRNNKCCGFAIVKFADADVAAKEMSNNLGRKHHNKGMAITYATDKPTAAKQETPVNQAKKGKKKGGKKQKTPNGKNPENATDKKPFSVPKNPSDANKKKQFSGPKKPVDAKKKKQFSGPKKTVAMDVD